MSSGQGEIPDRRLKSASVLLRRIGVIPIPTVTVRMREEVIEKEYEGLIFPCILLLRKKTPEKAWLFQVRIFLILNLQEEYLCKKVSRALR